MARRIELSLGDHLGINTHLQFMRTAKQRSISFIFVFVCVIGCKKGMGVCIAAQLELLWVGGRDSH